MTDAERDKEINLCRSYVEGAKRAFESLGIYIRRIDIYPFDTIGLGLLNKAFSLSDSVFLLLDAGMEDQAYALSRSIVECALSLRYLTEESDELAARTNKYIQFEKTEKQYWMYWALQMLKGTSRETAILDYAKDYGLSPDTKGASRHWSGENGFAWHTNLKDHPLDGDGTTELGKKAQYAVDYFQTSSYVHCSSTALDNFWPDFRDEFRIGERSGQKRFQKVLHIVLGYIHSCISYAIFGLGMERPQVFNELHSETLQSFAPFERQAR